MWFGRPGDLIELPDAEMDIDAPISRPMSAVTLLGGAVVQQMMGQISRDITVPWHWLTEHQAGILTGYMAGHRGRGPWVLITELDTNKLSPNQSSGTEADADATGFAVSNGTIASSTAQAYQDTRSLLWTLPGSVPGTPPSVTLTWPASSYGFPVVPLKDYSCSARVSADSATFDLRIDLRWYTAAGSLISTSSWASASPSGTLSDYRYYSISAQAPPTAAYVLPAIVAETMVTSGHVSIDHCQLELSSVATPWVPGMGSKRVSIQPISRGYPYRGQHHLNSVTFTEVGT